jgi:hypothetical protein
MGGIKEGEEWPIGNKEVRRGEVYRIRRGEEVDHLKNDHSGEKVSGGKVRTNRKGGLGGKVANRNQGFCRQKRYKKKKCKEFAQYETRDRQVQTDRNRQTRDEGQRDNSH